MTASSGPPPIAYQPIARRAGFVADILTVARRALRLSIREPEAVLPALFIPLFFFTVNIGALQKFVEANLGGLDFKAFQLRVAILNAVTGVSRAGSLATDIQIVLTGLFSSFG